MRTLLPKHILIVGLAALACALIGAIVGSVLIWSGGESSNSLRKLALQPSDLPPEFVLSEEKSYSREELMAELPANSQVPEQGLKEAIQLIYVSQEGLPIIEVYVYAYEDEDAARAAQAFAREPKPDELRPLDLGNGMSGYAFHDALVVEGLGEGSFVMTGIVSNDDGDQNTIDESRPVQIFFMSSGSARAEVLVAGESIFLDPQTAARNQYLRLEKPDAIVVP